MPNKGETEMIEITRLDNSRMVVNVEKIQSLQSTPDTVITFTNNVKMIVREPLEEISEKILNYRRSVNAKDSDTVSEYN
jgi:flagellar protein FlbD